MATPGRIPLSIDVGQYRTLPLDVRMRFDGWLEAEGLSGERIIRFRLGEGVIVAERYATDADGEYIVDDSGRELVTERFEYRIGSLPPAEAFGPDENGRTDDA